MRVHKSCDVHSLPLDGYRSVTVLTLGRGNNLDGTLNEQQQYRAVETLNVAAAFQERDIPVRVIWTGYTSRKRVSRGTPPRKSEARAMFEFAESQLPHLVPSARVEDQVVEEKSTNTVENMTNSHSDILSGSLIVVLTDDLHYKWGRVSKIAQITFPGRQVLYLSIGTTEKENFASELKQIASRLVLAFIMIRVQKGNVSEIRKRQNLLNSIFMRRQPSL